MKESNRKIFLDCGSNMGMGFSELAPVYNVDSDWMIYAFEPNIHSFSAYKENIESKRFGVLNDKNITLYNKAVWDSDGVLSFCMERVTLSSYENDPEWRDACDKLNAGYANGDNLDFIDFDLPATGGSCVKDFKESLVRDPQHGSKLEFDEPVDVECIDFSKWVIDNINKDDFAVLKMDIEGSEYRVLPKMIEDRSILYINELVIEWHDWQLSSDYRNKTNEIKNALSQFDIAVKDWK